jgi:AbiV family abortive infection protein
MTTNIDEQTLLEGAWFALEQAGRLLGSATILFESGDCSTALAVAMFGREELGRSRLLRDCAREVCNGKLLTPDKIKRRCSDHVEKQKPATFHIPLQPTPGSQEHKALTDLNEHKPGSEQWNEARDVLDSAVEEERKRQPKGRHQRRMSSLYVDPNDSGTGPEWLRPVNITEDEARSEINSAISDYNHEVDRLTNEESHPALEQYQPHLSVKAMSIARSKMSHPVDIPRLGWLDV